MATPTATQLVMIEGDETYKSLLRMNVLNQAAYWKGQNGVGLITPDDAEAFYRGRSLAESLLASPQVSVDKPYWSSRSMATLKNLDLAGIDANSDMTAILAALTPHYEYIAVQTYELERKKILF